MLEDNHLLFEWILSHNDDEQKSNYHFKICTAVSMKLWQEKKIMRKRDFERDLREREVDFWQNLEVSQLDLGAVEF